MSDVVLEAPVVREAPVVQEPLLPELEQPGWHSGNPVAQAHARARGRVEPVEADHPIARVLVWTVLIPAIVLLVSNPVGWIVLFLLALGGAFLFGFGGIL
jgi:hypothetical protein